MKKTTYLMIVMSVFVVLFASACGGAATPAASGQTFAPACQAATSCAAPAVIDTVASDRYCVDKVPYQNILIDDGDSMAVRSQGRDQRKAQGINAIAINSFQDPGYDPSVKIIAFAPGFFSDIDQ